MAATIELLVVEVCVDQLAAQPGGSVGLDPGRLPHEVRQVQAAADRGAGGGAETARGAAWRRRRCTRVLAAAYWPLPQVLGDVRLAGGAGGQDRAAGGGQGGAA